MTRRAFAVSFMIMLVPLLAVAGSSALEVRDALPMAFEPNVGQTDGRVRFVARGRGYSVFVTPGEVALGLGREALRMSWVGGSAEPRVVATGSLSGRSNYLVGSDASAWRRNVPTYSQVRCEDVYPGVDLVLHGNQEHLEYDFEVAPGADASRVRLRLDGHTDARIDENGDLVLRMRGGELRQLRPVAYEVGAAGARRQVAARYELRGDGEIGFSLPERTAGTWLVVDPVLVYGAFIGGSESEDEVRAVAVDGSGAVYVAGDTSSIDFPATPGAFDTTSSGFDIFVAKVSPSGASFDYATYIGGASGVGGIAVDASGAVYVAGSYSTADFPATPGAFDVTPPVEDVDAFVAKVSPSGASLVYATFLGGLGSESVGGIALAPDGSVVVAGSTGRSGFPVTPGAYDTVQEFSASEIFVTKLSPSGAALVYSTYLGGAFTEEAGGVALGPDGSAYVTGKTQSHDYPLTPGAFDTTPDPSFRAAVVTRLAANGGSLVYSTLLGGSGIDTGRSVAVDATGAAYVVGTTTSSNFPTTPGALDTTLSGGSDAFVVKLVPNGASLAYGTLVGGLSLDNAFSVAVDASGSAYVAGNAGGGFPTTPGAYDTAFDGGTDGFVLKLSSGGALTYSTYFGSHETTVYEIAVDATGAAYVVGQARTAVVPQVNQLPGPPHDGVSGFVAKLSPSGSALVFASAVGGTSGPGLGSFETASKVAVDATGAVYVVGYTSALLFPASGLDESFDGPYDAYVAKLDASGSALEYATFLGGTMIDIGRAIGVDDAGSAYVVGTTGSSDFPVTGGAFDTTLAGANDLFAVKLNPAGDGLVYSTLLGGSSFSDEELVGGIRLAPNGDLLVTGSTPSANFPTTPEAYDTTYNGGGDAFVTRLNAAGSGLVFSTFLGGPSTERGYGVDVDASGAVYVAGYGDHFPVTPGGHDLESARGFLAKLAPGGGSLVYSARTAPPAIDLQVDASGAVYAACGPDWETSFPDGNIEVLKLNPAGSEYEYSKIIVSPGIDAASDMALAPDGTVYVVGTPGSPSFPTTPDAYDRTGDPGDGILFALSPGGQTLAYSTFLGGDGIDVATGVALDSAGDVYVVGRTGSSDFVTTGFGSHDGYNSYVAKLRVVTGDTPGVYAPSSGAWFLRDANSPGPADLTFGYGSGGALVPITGDWNGDGRDTPGLYTPATGAFFLRNTSAGGGADLVFTFGAGGATMIPIKGDWDGDGVDTVGLYDTSTGVFFLRNKNASGVADVVFTFGAGGAVPITGDWNGDGIDTVGLYDASTGAFFLRNENAPGVADMVFTFGAGGARPLAGDWNRDGRDTVGLYAPGDGTWFLRNANSPGAADLVFGYGPPGLVPLAGDWDGE